LCDRDILRHFTVKDETAILSEENKQEISEKFRTYLSPEQNELYQKLCKCAELLNEVFRGRKDEITHHTILQMFTLKDGVFEASTDVNFGYFLKQ
jgi:hypothetical protein